MRARALVSKKRGVLSWTERAGKHHQVQPKHQLREHPTPRSSRTRHINRIGEMNLSIIFLTSLLTTETELPPTHWGWDAHKVVCEIAYRRLSPAGKEMVDELMARDTIATFAEACLWADAVKYSTHESTYGYHFVNIPTGHAGYEANRDCSDPIRKCVVWAVPHYATMLMTTESDTERLEALKFVGHFIGDLHQPLHAGRPEDRGGNGVDVEFPDAEGTGFIDYNLHQIWDRRMLERIGITWPESVAGLMDNLNPADAAEWEDFDVVAWTNESYGAAETIVYDVPDGGRITQEYIDRAMEYSLVAIQRAGVRLAFVLNSIADGSLRMSAY